MNVRNIIKQEWNNRMAVHMNKRGQSVAGLQGFVWTLGIIGIMLAIVLVVLNRFAHAPGVNGTAQSAVNTTIAAIADIPGWLPIIVIIVIAAIILTLVFVFRRAGGGV